MIIYSDAYHSTVGVKIDKKSITLGKQELNLILWDIYGEDEFQKLQMSYLRGTAGYFLVVDGTRKYTLEKALCLQKRVEAAIGKVPFILVLNKYDLTEDWEIEETMLDELIEKNWMIIKGSAKTGLGVEQAFLNLAEKMLEK
jgi:small GTP-binding protein